MKSRRLFAPAVIPMLVLVMCGSPKPPLAQYVRDAAQITGGRLELVDGKSWYLYWDNGVPQYKINSCMDYLYNHYLFLYTDKAFSSQNTASKICGVASRRGVGLYVGIYT